MQETEKKDKTSILLESGTNELEIVEFSISGDIYGINVAKVREIIKFPDNVVSVPDSHPSVEGIANLRGRIVPVINLGRHLGKSGEIDREQSRVIITEFNQISIGFCVDAVDTIRRLSWTQIESPTGVLASEKGTVVAIIKFEDRMVLLLDFEKITAEIDPDSAIQGTSETGMENQEVLPGRSSSTILVAEDSNYILKLIVNTLEKAGYHVLTASDGLKAWEHLTSITDAEEFSTISAHINMLITDIEMPQMDGLHLIKNVKNHEKLKDMPCLVFSSLITDEMVLKCKSVGADGQISKPDIGNLVELIDSFLLAKKACP